MRFYSIFIRQVSRRIFPAALVAAAIFFISQTASAQCVPSPNGETTAGLQNDTSFVLAFYIDNLKKADVPIDKKSDYFEVTPGRHVFNAEAIIKGTSFWVTLIAEVPKGHQCTWTIVDPGETAVKKDA